MSWAILSCSSPATSIQQTIHHPKLNLSSLIYLSLTLVDVERRRRVCVCIWDLNLIRVEVFVSFQTRSTLSWWREELECEWFNGVWKFGRQLDALRRQTTRTRISMEFYFTASAHPWKIEDKKLSFYCDWTFINIWLRKGIFTFSAISAVIGFFNPQVPQETYAMDDEICKCL